MKDPGVLFPNQNQKNYLAIGTALMTKMTLLSGDKSNHSKDRTGGERVYKGRQHENPDNEPTKEVRGSIMKWCKNDCHDKPMWCGCKNCMNRADYSTAWKKRNESKETDSAKEMKNTSSEFKIALAAMTSPEDFAALQE